MSALDYKGPIIVTVSYFFLYYIFLLNILRTKLKLQKKYKENSEKFDRYRSQDPEMLAADRIQLNMLEHMPLFLILMWLYAIFVSISTATTLGGVYTLVRAIYPLLVGGKLGREIPLRIMPITFTGYIICLCFAVGLLISIF